MQDKPMKTVVVEVTEDKPYNRCIKCKHLGVRCDGPNFAAMSIDRMIEWIRLKKEYLGWSNARLADESGTPKGTVDRILAGGHADFKVGTIAPILKALVGGSWGQFPCADPDNAPPETKTLIEMLKAKEDALAVLQAELDASEMTHKAAELHLEEKNQRSLDYLKDQVKELKTQLNESRAENERHRKSTALLSVSTIVLLTIVVVALLIDRFNPNIGFFWLG